MDKLYEYLEEKLRKGSMPARILAGRFKYLDESAKYSNESLDPTYLPFYYYLGCAVEPKKVLTIGGVFGLTISAFLTSCKSVEKVVVNILPEHNERITRANLKRDYRGHVDVQVCPWHDVDISDAWDLVIVDRKESYDDARLLLNTIWPTISENGLLCIEYAKEMKDVIRDLSISSNREVKTFPTRYGTSLIRK